MLLSDLVVIPPDKVRANFRVEINWTSHLIIIFIIVISIIIIIIIIAISITSFISSILVIK